MTLFQFILLAKQLKTKKSIVTTEIDASNTIQFFTTLLVAFKTTQRNVNVSQCQFERTSREKRSAQRKNTVDFSWGETISKSSKVEMPINNMLTPSNHHWLPTVTATGLITSKIMI